MSENDLREILRPMRAIRRLEPPTARARLAIYRVQEQLGKADVAVDPPPSFSLRRALIPAGIAAAILVIATGLYVRQVQTLASRSLAHTPRVSPQPIRPNERQQLQQAVASSNGYQGWVDVRVNDQVVEDRAHARSTVMLTALRVNPSQGQRMVVSQEQRTTIPVEKPRLIGSTTGVELTAPEPSAPALPLPRQPAATSMLIPLTWDAKAIPIPLTWEGTSTRFATPDVSIKRHKDGPLDVFSVASQGQANIAWPTSAPATPQAQKMLIYVDPNTNLVKQVQAMFRQQDQLRMTTVDYDYRPTTAPATLGE